MIPFNKPFVSGKELWNIAQAHAMGQMSGDGEFTRRCQRWLEMRTQSKRALLTHSCTAALEMAAILARIGPGDEVILPSYTFVSTANCIVLRGAKPVFVDIRPDTLNLDEERVACAVTSRTRAIIPVHYAGVGCNMAAIMEIARHHRLVVIEDAAQGILSTYRDKALGTIGDLGTLSFHETKNIISGEGGALLINSPELVERAEIIREKGTDRSRFFRGQVDKYTWTDIGSSYLPGEIIAAFLAAQMDEADQITSNRMAIWNRYHSAFEALENIGRLRRPVVPQDCSHNAHMYYLLLRDLKDRTQFIQHMKSHDINCVFHYVPLHSSPYGLQVGRASGNLDFTNNLSERLVRLPLWIGMEREQNRVIDSAIEYLC